MDTEQTNSEETTPEVNSSTDQVESTETQSDTGEQDQQTETQETSGEQDSESQVETTPDYKPNYKITVYGKEQDIDKDYQALIKDAASEKIVKELYGKKMAFDTLQEKNEKVRNDYQGYQQSTQPVVQYYNLASKMLQQKDLEGFFNLVKIPDEEIFRYAVQRAEEANLDPQQRYQLQQQRQNNRDRFGLMEQNQALQTQNQQTVSDYRTQELNWMISRPEISQVASSYDQRVNQPGAFRNMVIQKGLAHHAMTNGKEDLTAEQAVSEVMKYLAPLLQNQPQANGVQPSPGQNQIIAQPNGQPPIIPKVQGRGSSPVKKQVRSIEDIKKRRDELGAASRSS